MKKIRFIFPVLALGFVLGCSKDNVEVDTIYPEINVTATSFPNQCSTITRGQTFTFSATFSDNVELGSSSIDIHHNFDQHSHSTEVSNCSSDAVKMPVNPFVLIRTIAIPAGNTTYTVNEQIQVPANVDPGDYHFMIRVTDKAGWQTLRGISIKII
ncbi:DUF4625 domain-containing protein [Pedobacter sp. AW1-32]|uniref:DUF4625 domain-containing protein n=1 Tax=Pedobacter sp. AW1-32 TaxID=3383026 RepID=UPI003FEEB549